MKVMPIRYVADMAASIRFYEVLGLDAGDQSRSGNWAELPAAGGMVALHTALTSENIGPGEIELSFEAEEPLEKISERLTTAGFEHEAIVDEAFGRSLGVRDPDGVRLQINEHDRELYA
jgi:catechol 2,3-dioxygenase-like lactoylglutathione lyase family enzyme